MKTLLTFAALLCLGILQGCSGAAPNNVYAATPQTIFAILDDMDIPSGPQGPLGTLDITKDAVEPKSISWTGAGAGAAVKCTAALVPLDAARTQVELSCDGGVPGAGMPGELARLAMIEQIDSTLRGRPFNWETVKAQGGASLMQAAAPAESEALKASREAEAAHAQAQPQPQGQPPAPGEPLVDPTVGQAQQPVPPAPGDLVVVPFAE